MIGKLPELATKLHDGTTRCFNDLEDHAEHYEKEGSIMSYRMVMAKKLKSLGLIDGEEMAGMVLPSPKSKRVQDIILKVMKHAKEITSLRLVLGAGLYIEPSVFKHRCVSNADISYDGIKLTVYALSNIGTDEEISVQFLRHKFFDGPKVRKRYIQGTLFKDCDCIMCQLGDKKEIELRAKFARVEERIPRMMANARKDLNLRSLKELKEDYQLCLDQVEVLPVSGMDPVVVYCQLIEAYAVYQDKTGDQRPDIRMDPKFLEYFQQLKGHLKDDSDVSRFTEEDFQLYIRLKSRQQMKGNIRSHQLRNHTAFPSDLLLPENHGFENMTYDNYNKIKH